MRGVLIGAVALLAGCSGLAEDTPHAELGVATTSVSPAEQAPCELELTPSPELASEVGNAAERWSRATGCDVHVGDAGVPVWLTTEPMIIEGHDYSGLTQWRSDVGWTITVIAARRPTVIPHEIGHVLKVLRRVEPLAPADAHLADGPSLMNDNGGAGLITAADLEYVCADLPCLAFVPEV